MMVMLGAVSIVLSRCGRWDSASIENTDKVTVQYRTGWISIPFVRLGNTTVFDCVLDAEFFHAFTMVG
jgi:hypothetical protein